MLKGQCVSGLCTFEDSAFVSSQEWPELKKFSRSANSIKWRSGSIHADSVWLGPEELWIVGLTALVIHPHFKHVPVYLTGCNYNLSDALMWMDSTY